MESGFGGADFGNVRLHAGSDAADLNQRLGAQAFTLGSDIYLGAGTPALDTTAGQGLLAHELAHTMQQGASAQRRIRRLAYNKPIKNVTSINVFQGGASGLVAQVSDGKKPVIVKANQANAAEVVAADKLQRGGRFKSGDFKVKAPKSRIASGSDIAELKAKVNSPGVMTSPDPRNFVTGLDGQHPTLIAEAMEGDTLKSQLVGAVSSTTTTGTDGKKSTTYQRDDTHVDSIKKLLSSTSAIAALTKSMAADVAMGMTDRILILFNAENFLYDAKAKKFNFVDNTSSDAAGSLTSKMTAIGYENARSNFNSWASKKYVANLSSNPDELAQKIVENFTGLLADGSDSGGYGIMGGFRLMGRASRQDNDMNDVYNELSAVIVAMYPKLLAASTKAVKSGRQSVVKQLGDPLALTAGLPENLRLEAVTSLLARRAILKGTATDADSAWESANVQAHKLLKLKFKPAVPALNTANMPKLGTT